MKTPIVVIGANGRMGRTIADLVLTSEHYTLAGAVDSAEKLTEIEKRLGQHCPVSDDVTKLLSQLTQPGVLIDFTAPTVSLHSAQTAALHACPAVIGTTGFNKQQKEELAELAKRTPLLWSSNMSLGVNVLNKILPEVAKLLGADYDIEVMEIHHKHKKDAPSGTALTLASGVAEARGWADLDAVRCAGRDGLVGERPQDQLGIHALRGGDVVGVHTVYFFGQGERIEISHHAHSRENFARGALKAATWLLQQKPGRLYHISDMLIA